MSGETSARGASTGFRHGVLLLNSWAGLSRQLVAIVGETQHQFIVASPISVRLSGRRRSLVAGELGLVPKTAVTFNVRAADYEEWPGAFR